MAEVNVSVDLEKKIFSLVNDKPIQLDRGLVGVRLQMEVDSNDGRDLTFHYSYYDGIDIHGDYSKVMDYLIDRELFLEGDPSFSIRSMSYSSIGCFLNLKGGIKLEGS